VFIDLLLRGLALPGIIATAEGYAPPSTGDGHHANREGRCGSLIPFRGKDRDDYPERQDRQAGFAVGNLLPIVAVGERNCATGRRRPRGRLSSTTR
jgi:hypothetical protein